MKITQIVNTLAINDGGPSRNSFELNISLNRNPKTTARLFWVHGSKSSSVVNAYDGAVGSLPEPAPTALLGHKSIVDLSKSIIDFYKSIRNSDIVIFHGYYLPWIPLVAFFLNVWHIPYVFTPHGSLTSHQQKTAVKKKMVFDLSLGKYMRRRALGFVTGSEVEAQELRKKFNGSRVEVAGVGTALSAVHRSGGAWGQPVRLLSLSRIAPKKRIDLTIAATKILRDSGLDVVLDIVGTGEREIVNDLRVLVKNFELTESVIFHGQLAGQRKTEIYLAADIFVLPSDDENFGIGLAEALAHGIPVVASSAVASAQYLNSEAGKVIVSPSSEDLAESIRQIVVLGDAALYRRRARDTAVESFSWDTAVKKWTVALSRLGQGLG